MTPRLRKHAGRGLWPAVALVAGLGSKLISPKKNSARLHQDVPHSALALPGGAGHMLHYIKIDAIVATIDHL